MDVALSDTDLGSYSGTAMAGNFMVHALSAVMMDVHNMIILIAHVTALLWSCYW